MTGFLLAFVFAAGIGLIWLGSVGGVRFSAQTGRGLRRWHGRFGRVRIPLVAAVAGLPVGWIVFALVGVPILALGAGFAGAYAPLLWRRRGLEAARRVKQAST